MKFFIAKALQQRWVEHPPAGWIALQEVGLISNTESRMLGYEPKADLLQHDPTASR